MEDFVARKKLLNAILNTPHRDYGKLNNEFQTMLNSDPYFAGRALVWLFNGTSIRDHQDTAIVSLLLSNPEYDLREAGEALFAAEYYRTANTSTIIDPYRLLRIFNFVMDQAHSRRMERLMTNYFDYLEWSGLSKVEQVELYNRPHLKAAFKRLRLASKDYPILEMILFEENYPKGSPLEGIKQISRVSDPIEKARIGIEYKIPYRKLATILPKGHPATGIALIEVMTPEEAVNSRGWVEKFGLLNITEVKQAYLMKISQATKSSAKLRGRKSVSTGVDVDVDAAVQEAAEKSIKRQEPIMRRTAIFIDASGSMQGAIEFGKKFVEHIAPIVENKDSLYIAWFKSYAKRVKPQRLTIDGMDRAMRAVFAGGGTSIQSAWDLMQKDGFEAEQVVILSDFCDPSGFVNRIPQLDPHFVLVGLEGGVSGVCDDLGRRSFPNADILLPKQGDWTVMDQMSLLLGGKPKETIVDKVLEVKLPYVISRFEVV